VHGRRHQGVVRRRSSQRGAPRRRRQGGDGRRARELKLADAASAAREHVTWFWMSVQGEPVDAQTGAVVVYGDASTKLGTSRYPPDALEGAPTRSPRPRPCPRSRSSRASARRSSCRRRATTPRTRTPGAASSPPGASGAAVRRAGRRSHRGAHRGRLPRPSPGRRRPRLPGRRSARSGPPCSGRGSRWPPWPHPGRARRPPQEARRDGPGQAGLAHPKAIKRKIRVDNVISVSQLAPYSSLTSSFRATRFFPLQCALRR